MVCNCWIIFLIWSLWDITIIKVYLIFIIITVRPLACVEISSLVIYVCAKVDVQKTLKLLREILINTIVHLGATFSDVKILRVCFPQHYYSEARNQGMTNPVVCILLFICVDQRVDIAFSTLWSLVGFHLTTQKWHIVASVIDGIDIWKWSSPSLWSIAGRYVHGWFGPEISRSSFQLEGTKMNIIRGILIDDSHSIFLEPEDVKAEWEFSKYLQCGNSVRNVLPSCVLNCHSFSLHS